MLEISRLLYDLKNCKFSVKIGSENIHVIQTEMATTMNEVGIKKGHSAGSIAHCLTLQVIPLTHVIHFYV